ncbi:hypothetical protein GY45DRAFT_1309840 [Cubamyces sp. BRFM 1775]|nr:hypothetical protein GY45DRAFT_1309840 [Cubamyces sp. BRFM 1775]
MPQDAEVQRHQREASPAKKRKLMHTPDGFESGRRASNAKAPARKFTSAFDDPRKSKFSTKALPQDARLPQAQPVPGPSRGSVSVATNAPAQRQRPMTLVTKPVLPRSPLFEQHIAGPSSRPMQRRNASILAAHRISSPAPEKPRAKPISKGTIQQFQPILPAPSPAKDSPKNLRPLHAPPPPAVGPRPHQDASKMKTISTTRVAVTMDPRTESGVDELLGIYLEQQAGNYVPPAERELQRGLGQSPEKASKSKSAKFVRGGLAERAQHIFAKHNTTLTLWYKDMELQAQRPKAHSRIAPDMELRIVEVLHVSSVASLQRSQGVPRLCTARCTRVVPSRKQEEDIVAVLDFGSPGSAPARAHTLDDVQAGRELHVWRPWNTTERLAQDILPDSLIQDVQMPRRLPSNCSIVFCTRFRILNDVQ